MEDFLRMKSHVLLGIICVLSWGFCWSLNDEGVALLRFKEKIESDPQGALSNWIEEVGVENPCSWFGVGCSHGGYVVVLNLTNLCLRGTMSADIANLIHIKSINLCNNSFSGVIPEEIGNLKELEVLDLRYNNFTGQLLCQHLGNRFSTAILRMEGTRSPVGRKLLQQVPIRRTPPLQLNFPLPPPRNLPPSPTFQSQSIPSPAPTPTPSLVPPPTSAPTPSPEPFEPSPSPSSVNRTTSLSLPTPNMENSRTNRKLIISIVITGSILLVVLIIGIIYYQSRKVATVKPWATGLSGQLQRAFVTGVPKLKRSELEAACEDFSNVIGSLSGCTLYKGTLSSGVEIAVGSIDTLSSTDWSSRAESEFRMKIDTLSKVNHKNFISLIGYCEEDKPFTRMMVFEYAPNGTLFEHLHIKEAEHLDWPTRLRVAMGIAYCLDHMHQMTPALAHRNLTSSSIYLTEDYAAKVSDFIFWDKGSAAAECPSSPPRDVYSFGVILFEIITGKLPYSSGADSLDDWASDYLRGMQSLSEMIDPMLRTYSIDQLQQLEEVIKPCTEPDPRRRPSMMEVCARLRMITKIGPDGANPKSSPLWWAEVEIQSTETA